MTILDSIQKGDIAITPKGYITRVKQVEVLPSDTRQGLLQCEYENSCICDFFRPDQLKEIKRIGPRIQPRKVYSYQLSDGKIRKTEFLAMQDSENEDFFFAYTLNGVRNKTNDFHSHQLDTFDDKTKTLLSYEKNNEIVMRMLKTAISLEKEKMRKELAVELLSATIIENYEL